MFFFVSCNSAIVSNKNIVAEVGQEKIFVDKLIVAIKKNTKETMNIDHPLFEKIKITSLNQLIYKALIKKYSDKYKLSLHPNEFSNQFKKIENQPNKIIFTQLLKEQGISNEEWKQKTRFSILEKKVIRHIEQNHIKIDPKEIREYYEKHKEMFTKKRTFKIKSFNFLDKKIAAKALVALRNKYSINYLQKNYNLTTKDMINIELHQLDETPWSSLSGKSKGATTEILKRNNQYQIAQLTAIKNKETLKLKSVESEIKNILISNKNLNYEQLLKNDLNIRVQVNSTVLDLLNIKNWRFK